ncbi:MAG: DUF1049 domain-containing protein [Firmicutes bacterium]|jgi:uncharacterized integral membrane protein|nr:DUF1049 domain-containing protein [Bacillota bacterium]
MGSLLLIFSLLFTLLIAIIAAANHQPVVVNYLFGRAELPLIVLIAGAAAAGALAVGLFSLYRGIRSALETRADRKCREELRARLAGLEQEKGRLQGELARLQQAAEPPEEGESP